ncbi:GNAT family N-acetyltransferase [Microlunatus parietis]|uniref:Ribosomal protein S18 acetylase RimI-like enzyme n=1 Tax=Microlunatus parietis TaxID=682979 RepID=A0A7Y9LD00_9ACTN|nr:GNAT family N-acetyltransferase [Microlunatus parietis]NYE72240.1 ribosomal protein S18 acetylase RimI-like enzyme [Microlunatus parietis]
MTEIRLARPDDAAAVAQIWYDGWQQAHRGRVPDELVEVRTRESFDTRAAALVEETSVADRDGTIIGFIMINNDEVEQVYVAEAGRGTGIADTLLAEAERRIAAGGHSRAWLAVVADNTRARRFYERNGWTDEGLFDHLAPGPDGPIPVPCHRYAKPLTT